MKYRAELDGLRAIALVAVILFHAGFKLFNGGFVGVDIFFVMSGYLITTIIYSDLEREKFSIVDFYGRRARRIFPALYLVMFVSLPFAWAWLRPPDMKDFAQSLVAIPYQVSNVLFWLETGYWGTDNALKPFIHTWSIAIEAQFYLIFPFALILIARFRKSWLFPSVLLITVGSFAVSQWGAYHLPSANFFLLPSRLWELAMGACIGLGLIYRKPVPRPTSTHQLFYEVMGCTGLVLVVYSIFAFDETVPVPSLFTLLPTLGTALIIIFSSDQSLVGRWLSHPALVGLGLISYSAYLWHQPMLAFARHGYVTEPNLGLTMALIVLLIPLAYLSWRYVEQPFRKKAVIGKKAGFILWLIASVALIEIGVVGHMTEGFIGRNSTHAPVVHTLNEIDVAPLNRVSASTLIQQLNPDSFPPGGQTERQYNYGLSVTCDGPFTLSSDCRTSEMPEILVWGDSFAMQLVPGIMASNPDAKIIQMTKSACGPLFDLAPIVEPDFPLPWAQDCLEFTGQVQEWLKTNQSIKYAVLASPFSHYHLEDRQLLHRSGERLDANLDLALQELKATLSTLKSLGIEPVVFSPPPSAKFDLGRCLARAEWMGLSLQTCDYGPDEIVFERAKTYRFLDSIQTEYPVFRLDKRMCQGDRCTAHINDIKLYRDSLHLTVEGAAILGKRYDFYQAIIGHQPAANE